MKAVIETTRHYYKYNYSTFTQPTLTANGTFGGSQMAVSHVVNGCNSCWGTTYTAFSPNTSNVGFYCDEWGSSMYFNIYLPKPTKITNLSFFIPYTGSSSGGAYNTLFYGGYGVNDRNTLLKNVGTIGENSTCNVALTDSNYFQYFTLYFANGGHSYEDQVEINSIKLSGQCREIIESTSADFSFYKDIPTYKVVKENSIYKTYKF